MYLKLYIIINSYSQQDLTKFTIHSKPTLGSYKINKLVVV